MKNVTILGATGSIGDSTLSVLALHPDKFNVFALSAHTNWKKMQALCEQFQPTVVVMTDTKAAQQLSAIIQSNTEVLSGAEALDTIAAHEQTDYVMAAMVSKASAPLSTSVLL